MNRSPNLHSDFVVGFHGTDARTAEDVTNGRDHLDPSPRGYDWLGDGIYFWEDDPERAYWWAQRAHEQSIQSNKDYGLPVKVESPAVVGALIYVGNCLNLSFKDNQKTLQTVYSRVEERYKNKNWKLPTNDFYYRNLDCLIVNETCRALQRQLKIRIDTVRGVLAGATSNTSSSNPEFLMSYPSSLIFAEPYKIICVRTRKVIVSYFEVTIE